MKKNPPTSVELALMSCQAVERNPGVQTSERSFGKDTWVCEDDQMTTGGWRKGGGVIFRGGGRC